MTEKGKKSEKSGRAIFSDEQGSRNREKRIKKSPALHRQARQETGPEKSVIMLYYVPFTSENETGPEKPLCLSPDILNFSFFYYIYLPADPCSRRFSVNQTASRKRLPSENDPYNMKKAAANVLVRLRRMEFSDAITSYISET